MGNWEDCKKCKNRKDCEYPEDFWYRGCRLRHVFKGCYKEENGLLFFDTKKMFKKKKVKK